jgi:hypothetical protein
MKGETQQALFSARHDLRLDVEKGRCLDGRCGDHHDRPVLAEGVQETRSVAGVCHEGQRREAIDNQLGR